MAPRAGTVQWRGKDRYVDIDNLASTPAWVRRKAKLTNPYEGRPAGKAALKDSHKEAASGASDQETDETPKSQPSTLF